MKSAKLKSVLVYRVLNRFDQNDSAHVMSLVDVFAPFIGGKMEAANIVPLVSVYGAFEISPRDSPKNNRE